MLKCNGIRLARLFFGVLVFSSYILLFSFHCECCEHKYVHPNGHVSLKHCKNIPACTLIQKSCLGKNKVQQGIHKPVQSTSDENPWNISVGMSKAEIYAKMPPNTYFGTVIDYPITTIFFRVPQGSGHHEVFIDFKYNEKKESLQVVHISRKFKNGL